MTEYGFISLNLPGSVLIDDTYANYTFKQASSTVITTGWNNITFASGTTNNVIYGVRPTTDGFIYFGGLIKSGANYTGFRINTSANMTIYWIVFEDALQNALPAYGMVVYDENADVTFSSNEKYMKLVGTRTGASASSGKPGGTPGTIGVTDVDNNYFYMQTTNYYYSDINKVPDVYYKIWTTGLKKNTSTSLYEYTENEVFSGTTSQSPGGEANGAAGQSGYTLLEIEDTS